MKYTAYKEKMFNNKKLLKEENAKYREENKALMMEIRDLRLELKYTKDAERHHCKPYKEEIHQLKIENAKLKKQIDEIELNFYKELFSKINVNIGGK